MKRIYLLMVLFVAAMGNSYGQNTDLQVLTSLKSIDTMNWSTQGHYGKIIVYGFTNLGPVTLSRTVDTVILDKGYYRNGNNRWKYTLPVAGFAPGDTLYPVDGNGNIKPDTVIFTSAPSTNPYNWCDTVNRWTASGIVTDAQPSNNSKCVSMRFIQLPNVTVENVENTSNGLNVYPNPALFSISFRHNYDGSNVNVNITDITGKTVHSSTVKELYGDKEVHIDISKLTPGMYVLEVQDQNGKRTSKFTINK